MEDWKEFYFYEIITRIADGGTPPRNDKSNFGEKYNWVVIDDIKDEIYETKEKLSDIGIRKASTHLWPIDTVILSTGATIGEVGVLRKESGTKQGICGIELDKNKILSKYFFYYLKTMKPKFLAFAQGSTIKEIRPKTILNFQIHLPKSTKEQAKIAEILTKIDESIAQTEALIEKYKSIKTGLMQDLLSKGIDADGKIRSYETHQFKDSPIGKIPLEWEMSTVSKSLEICNNLRFPISEIEREKIKGSYPYYGPTGILDYINECRVIGKYVLIGEDGDHFLKWQKQEMTILIDGKFNVNNHAHLLKGTASCLTEWFHEYFMHRDITNNLTRQGAGRFKLNKAALQEMIIALPDVEEQKRIITFSHNVRLFLQEIQNEKIKLQATKTGLMQDLLSGRVRVTNLLNN